MGGREKVKESPHAKRLRRIEEDLDAQLRAMKVRDVEIASVFEGKRGRKACACRLGTRLARRQGRQVSAAERRRAGRRWWR